VASLQSSEELLERLGECSLREVGFGIGAMDGAYPSSASHHMSDIAPLEHG